MERDARRGATVRRQVCWVDRLDDGVKREARVSFEGRNQLKWQFKRSDADAWDYDTPPSREDWQRLIKAMEGRYQRNLAPYKDVEMVRRLARAAFPNVDEAEPAR